MKKNYWYFLYSLLAGICFLLTAPINQSLAVAEGGACSFGTRAGSNIACDTNLECDVRNDTSTQCDAGIVCRGTCRKACAINLGDPPGHNGGCASGNFCDTRNSSSCNSYGCAGYCLPDINRIPVYGSCQTKISTDKQGNCVSGAFCNTGLNKTCSGFGGCSGICFPNNYSCNPTYDSRSGVTQFICPNPFTCAEASGKTVKDVCVPVEGGGWSCYKECPGCLFVCVPAADIAISCTCDSSGIAQAERNGFTCKRGNVETQHFFCKSAKEACWNDSNYTASRDWVFGGQSATGARCNTIEDNKKLTGNIDPPKPPCTQKDANGKCLSLNTSLGLLSTDPRAFILSAFGILLAGSGGIAGLLFMRAGYQIMSARGNPEGLQKGREQMIAAGVGLLFLIFSLVVLQTLGADLLRIPGFAP